MLVPLPKIGNLGDRVRVGGGDKSRVKLEACWIGNIDKVGERSMYDLSGDIQTVRYPFICLVT